MQRKLRVAFVFEELIGGMVPELFLGAYGYACAKPNWDIQRIDDRANLSWDQAIRIKPDGIIGTLFPEDHVSRKQTGTSRVLILNSAVADHPFHRVISDSREVGRRVGRYLLERHLRQFAFVGAAEYEFSRLRLEGFKEVLRDANCPSPVSVYDHQDIRNDPKGIKKWLLSLPRPCGVFCSRDEIGVTLIRTCLKIGLSVPNDMAIASATNEELRCIQSPVPLSSLDQNFREVGRRGAAHLDAWFRGVTGSTFEEYVLPGEMVERGSSRMHGVADPLVRRALEIIFRDYQEEFTVETLLDRIGRVSRRQLEMRFREVLGRSPHQEIVNCRVREAQRLLRSTQLPLEEVSYRAGFYDVSHLCLLFKKVIGITPARYRKQSSLGQSRK